MYVKVKLNKDKLLCRIQMHTNTCMILVEKNNADSKNFFML